MQCELLVIGETPEGWAAAEFAARAGARTLVVRPPHATNPAAGLLAAVRAACQDGPTSPVFQKPTCGPVSPAELCRAAVDAYERRIAWRRRELGILVRRGRPRLINPTTARIFSHGSATTVNARLILIASGTTARRPRESSLHHETSNDATARIGSVWTFPEEATDCQVPPEKLIVVGGNPTALAFARLFAVAGSDVTMIDGPQQATTHGADDGSGDPTSTWPVPRIRDDMTLCQTTPDGVMVRTAGGRTISGDQILFAARRQGATRLLGLSEVGLEADDRGRLWCDDHAMTWVPTIAAAGEVLGYPAALRYDSQAIQRTIADKLRLGTSQNAPVVSIPIDHPLALLNKPAEMKPTAAKSTPRIRRRPPPQLRLYDHSRDRI